MKISDLKFSNREAKRDYDRQRYLNKIKPASMQTLYWQRRIALEKKRKRAIQNQNYYRNNKEKVLERVKEYTETYPEYRKNYYTHWQKENKQTRNEYKRIWRKNKRSAQKSTLNVLS